MRRIVVTVLVMVLGLSISALAQEGLLKWPQSGTKPARPTGPPQPAPSPGPKPAPQPPRKTVPPVVVPGQKVLFRDHFRVGEKFINTFTFRLGATLNIGGQAQKLTYKSFERYAQVVRAVDQNRHPTQVLRKYYVAYEVDQGRRTNKWYVNKILQLTRQGGRTVVRAKSGPVPAAVQQDLSDELKPLDLSDGPKAQGERWVLTERTLRQFMDLPPQARGTVRCRWSRTITSKSGHKVAVLTADLVLTMPLKAGLSMDLDLTGKLFYNLSLGKLEVVYLKGPVTIKGAVLQQGRRVAVRGKGQARMIMIRRFGG